MLASLATGHFIELITLFAIVFIHECGHAAAAALLGCRVLSIQMLPFGGVAVIEDGAGLRLDGKSSLRWLVLCKTY